MPVRLIRFPTSPDARWIFCFAIVLNAPSLSQGDGEHRAPASEPKDPFAQMTVEQLQLSYSLGWSVSALPELRVVPTQGLALIHGTVDR